MSTVDPPEEAAGKMAGFGRSNTDVYLIWLISFKNMYPNYSNE